MSMKSATPEQVNERGEPEVIFLQLHGDGFAHETKLDSYKSGEITWCWHSIFEDDVRYIRADLAHPAPMPHPSGVQVGALRELAERLDAAAKRVFACAPTVVSMTPVVGKDMAEWEALFYEASDALIAATKEAP